MNNVFAAVADPTRRIILESLRRQGPQSLKALSDPLPMSRQAVTKHLGVLATAGLVDSGMEGRERIHRLCADPLREMDDWLAPYAAAWDERLDRLRTHLETDAP